MTVNRHRHRLMTIDPRIAAIVLLAAGAACPKPLPDPSPADECKKPGQQCATPPAEGEGPPPVGANVPPTT